MSGWRYVDFKKLGEKLGLVYKGRNRWGSQVGLALFPMARGGDNGGGLVHISPINTRGQSTDSCYLQVPMASLGDIIKELEEIRREYLVEKCKACAKCREDGERELWCLEKDRLLSTIGFDETEACKANE